MKECSNEGGRPRPPCKFPPPRLLRGLRSGLCGRPGAPEKDSLREGEGRPQSWSKDRGQGWGEHLQPHPRTPAASQARGVVLRDSWLPGGRVGTTGIQ